MTLVVNSIIGALVSIIHLLDSARKENRKDVLLSYNKTRINTGHYHDPRSELNIYHTVRHSSKSQQTNRRIRQSR